MYRVPALLALLLTLGLLGMLPTAALAVPPQIQEAPGANSPSFKGGPLAVSSTAEDSSAIYFETFESCDDWVPVNLFEGSGVQWGLATDAARDVFWCGKNDPNFSGGSGYGNNWLQALEKTFSLGAAPISVSLVHQYDTESNYDFGHVQVSTDGGTSWSTLASYDGNSGGYVSDSVDLSAYAGQTVNLRFLFTSDGAFSDADYDVWAFDSNGAWRLDEVSVTGFSTDTFDSGTNGWSAYDAYNELALGTYRLEQGPPCDHVSQNCPDYCTSWVVYDPVTEEVPYMTPDQQVWGAYPQYGIESPWIDVPADADSLFLRFDAFHDGTVLDGVFYDWHIVYEDAVSGELQSFSDGLVFYNPNGWREHKHRFDNSIPAGVTRVKVRLNLFDGYQLLQNLGLTWTGVHGSGPYFDNVAILAPGTSQASFDYTDIATDCTATGSCDPEYTFQIEDQDGAVFAAPYQPSFSISNAGGFSATVEQGDPIQLEPGTYTVLVWPEPNNQRTIYRSETLEVLAGSSQTVSYVWEMADVKITLVDDVNNDPIAGSYWSMHDTGHVPNGDTARRLTTVSPPGVPPVLGAGSNQVWLLPTGLTQGIVGAESIDVLPGVLNEHTFVWKYRNLTVNIEDQFGSPLPDMQWSVPVGGINDAGDTELLPVTEDADRQPFSTNANGYGVWVRANIGPGTMVMGHYGVEVGPGPNTTDGDADGNVTKTFVWPMVYGTLHVVDANGNEVPGASWSGVFGAGATGDASSVPVTEYPANQPFSSFATGYPVNITLPGGSSSGNVNFEMHEDETITPAFVEIDGQQYGLRWNLDPTYAFQLEDQFGNLYDTPYNPTFSVFNGSGFSTELQQGESVQLAPGNYSVRIWPEVPAGNRLIYRSESLEVLPGSSQTVTYVWETAEVKITLVDDIAGDPISGAKWGARGVDYQDNEATVRRYVTQSPSGVPPTASSESSGARISLFPTGTNQALAGNETIDILPGVLNEHTFVWKYRDLTVDIVDQFGDPIPNMQWNTTVSPILNSGESASVAVTEDSDRQPFSTNSDGLPVYARANIGPGTMVMQHGRVEVGPGPATTDGDADGNVVKAFVWPVVNGTLHVVDANENEVPGATWAAAFGSGATGDPVSSLPVTEYPDNQPFSTWSTGYPVTIYLPGGAGQGGGAFEILVDETITPAFVEINGQQVGLRWNLDVSVAGSVVSDCDGPLAGVTVTLLDGNDDSYSAVTDASGDYLFEGIPRTSQSGSVSIQVPEGYSLATGAAGAPISLDLQADQTVNFAPECVYVAVSGVVSSDCDGPLDGVDVSLDAGGALDLSTTTAPDGSYSFSGIRWSPDTVTVAASVPAGYTANTPAGATADVVLSADSAVDMSFDCVYVTVSGTVSACDGGLLGVTVDLDRDPLNPGAAMHTTVTDSVGGYSFEGLRYSGEPVEVSVVVPLGFEAVSPADGHVLVDITADATQNFDLACLQPEGQARSMGYWKHQGKVYIKSKGNAHETQEDMETTYPVAIFNHFYENDLNAISVEGVTYLDSSGVNVPMDLITMHNTLSVKGNAGMEAKAKQQYLAMLLNIASGKLLTSTVISDDGATASQALQQVAEYIEDGDSSNDEIAKDIADEINNAKLVAAGVIDLNIDTIYYRPGALRITQLLGARPSPFLGATSIAFSLAEAARAKVTVFDVQGRQVATLADEEFTAGPHTVTWNGRDAEGREVAAGMYFLHMQTPDYRASKRVVRLR